MRSVLAILLITASVHADTATDVRVRVALALAAASVDAKSDEPLPPSIGTPVFSYADAYAKAVKDHKPLAVFIGQPEVTIGSYEVVWVRCRDDSLAATPQVWVGIVANATGTMMRAVLEGTPTEADIKAAAHRLYDELNPPQTASDPYKAAVSQFLSQPLNVGRCPCGATGQGCHCQPHSLCAGGQCGNHNPLLRPKPVQAAQPQQPAYVPQYSFPSSQLPVYSRVCST
jgi:hypothetical protein